MVYWNIEVNGVLIDVGMDLFIHNRFVTYGMKKVQECINGIYIYIYIYGVFIFVGIHILERVQIMYIYQFTISLTISIYLEIN